MAAKNTVTSKETLNNERKSLHERLRFDRATAVVALSATAIGGVLVLGGADEKVAGHKPVAAKEASTAGEVDLAALRKILIGGYQDPSSRGLLDYLSNQGMINHSEDNYLVAYPADILKGEESAAIGSVVAKNAYYEAHARGDATIMVGFSQGTIPLARAATEIAEANGGKLPDDLTVVSYGGPVGEDGFFRSSFGEAAEPFINIAGIPTDNRLPAGSHDAASQNDFWARTGDDTWLGQIAKATALGAGAHRVPNINEPHISWTGEDGVHYSTYDVGVHPWTMVARANGLYINDGYNQFFNATVPVSNGRDPVADPNARDAIMGLAKAWDEQLNTNGEFQMFMQFIPALPLQIGLDIATKVPDAVVNGVATGVQAVVNAPQNTQNALDKITQVPASITNPGTVPSVTFDLVPELPRSSAPAEAINNVVDTIRGDVQTYVPTVEVLPDVPKVPTPQKVGELVETVKEVTNVIEDVVEKVVPPVPALEVPSTLSVAVEAPAPVPVYVAPPLPERVYVSPPVSLPAVELPPVQVPAPIAELLPRPFGGLLSAPEL